MLAVVGVPGSVDAVEHQAALAFIAGVPESPEVEPLMAAVGDGLDSHVFGFGGGFGAALRSGISFRFGNTLREVVAVDM